MHTTLKNVLGGALVVGILAVALSVHSFVRSYSKSIQPSSFRSFIVTGEGKKVWVPDVARFSFSVITEGGKDINKLLGENTEKVNRINKFVKDRGVPAEDLQTQAYNVEPRYQHYPCTSPPIVYPQREPTADLSIIDTPPGRGGCPPPDIVGYTVSQTVQVKVKNFEKVKVGELLTGAVKEGANSVSQLTFTVDDSSGLQNEARKEAIAKAKEKAEAVANAGGFGVGRLLSIEESFGGLPYYDYGIGRGGGEYTKSVPPPPFVEPGSQEIRVSVTLKYEIQ